MGARSKLRERGFYVLADVTKLPFKDGVFDATLSAHVLYHVPQDEQEFAVLEFQRTLKYGGSCVIIYEWPAYPRTKIAALFNAGRIIAKIPGARLLWRKKVKPIHPPLYFHAHDYGWFRKIFPDNWNIDIRCWRSLDNNFAKTFVPNNFWGQLLMRLIFWLEAVFPHALGRIGRHPMIVISKK